MRLRQEQAEEHGPLLRVTLDVFEADENGDVTLRDSRALLYRPLPTDCYLMNLQLIRTDEGVVIFLELHDIFMLYKDAGGQDFLAWRYEDETIQPAFMYACDISDIDKESGLAGSDGFVYTGTEYENGRVSSEEAYYAQYEELGIAALYGDDFEGAIRAFLTGRHGIQIDENGPDYESGSLSGAYLTSDNDMETLCTVNQSITPVLNADYSAYEKVTFERVFDRDSDLFPKEAMQEF